MSDNITMNFAVQSSPVELNIVDLIDNNPITKLTNTYHNRFLSKIKNNFTENEQHIFVASFYCFLNNNPKTDFVLDLDHIWEWLGFSQKYNAKNVLEKNFVLDKDYKIFAPEASGAKTGRGGYNKIKICMNIKTFKSLCLKAGTKKADQIHEYYIKLEETLQEVINEESNELRLQLEQNTLKLENHFINSQKEKEVLRERTILEQFSNNVQCVYYGQIDDVSNSNEPLIKFGNSNFLCDRVKSHKRTFNNFRLIAAFKVDNKVQVENAIKCHPILNKRRRTIILNQINQTELLAVNELSFSDLDIIIKDIITNIEYSPENYTKLLEENGRLKKTIAKLLRKLDPSLLEVDTVEPDNANINEVQYNNITVKLTRNQKQPDGLFHIDECTYKVLIGTREEVWKGTAYNTSGGLTKKDLIVNKYGKIVSVKKHHVAKNEKRLFNKAELTRMNETPPTTPHQK